MTALVDISAELSARVEELEFPSVPFVYNPLDYARGPHEAYLERWGRKTPREALLVGMNPGPFGMAQTGVPFGDVAMVRDFLGITGPVGRPAREHPRRPISGFACTRSEVSGTRLWGWVRDRFSTADRFFDRAFVANWCPLVFMDESGRNRTPDKLPSDERGPLFRACDEALARIVDALRPTLVVGIGRFAERRAYEALGDGARIGSIPHPSPASPAANRGWADAVDERLRELGFEPRG
ncbi:MAG TPA: uracil-DNA glycosylase family protein [Gaiellaceae bacterium]|nr:uracil-DNA glycosylase family protein [Gaiellaceae bacterium]